MMDTSLRKSFGEKGPDPMIEDLSDRRSDGYLLDASQISTGELNRLKTTDDGRTILYPQPTNHSLDPLGWSKKKKAWTLAIITLVTFLPDFGSGLGIGSLIAQTIYFDTSQDAVNRATAGNIFSIGAGGIVSVIFSSYFGNLPVLWIFQLISFGTGIWCATATSLESYTAARILNGLFCGVCQSTGLMWIKSMYFVHERPRAINIWSGAVIISPYLGPMVALFITSKVTWRWNFWLYSILNGIALILVFLFLDEAQFSRRDPVEQYNFQGSRLSRLLGIGQRQRRRAVNRSFFQVVANSFIALQKAPVILIWVYYYLNVSWIIGVNATLSVWLSTFYGFTSKEMGFFYFFGIIGSFFGEILGHWLHDFCGKIWLQRHRGRIHPEARLLPTYFATFLSVISLIIIGFALSHQWHYMVVAVMATIQVIGFNIMTAAINAYLLDAYPEGSGEMDAWLVFSRTTGGFMATYIQIPWVLGTGPDKVFGIQAAITAVSLVFIATLQVYGRQIRRSQGPMKFSMDD